MLFDLIQAYLQHKNTSITFTPRNSQTIHFSTVSTDIPVVVPRPVAEEKSTGFEFLKEHLRGNAFFRLWPGAPLADAVAVSESNPQVIDLIQAFYPLSREQKRSHEFRGFDDWMKAFPDCSFRYFTVTYYNFLRIIGWPDGLTEQLQESFTPFLIGITLDKVPAPTPSTASAAGAVEEEEIDEEEVEEEEEKEEKSTPEKSRKKRRTHCCPCYSGTCDRCRCSKISRCDSSCQSPACHFQSGVCAGVQPESEGRHKD